jgi:hypothetical protein
MIRKQDPNDDDKSQANQQTNFGFARHDRTSKTVKPPMNTDERR